MDVITKKDVKTLKNNEKQVNVNKLGIGKYIIYLLLTLLCIFVMSKMLLVFRPPQFDTPIFKDWPTPTVNKKSLVEENIDLLKWRLYSNSETNLLFKYPQDWKLSETSNEITIEKPLSPECRPAHNCGGNFEGISIKSINNNQKLPLKAFIKQYLITKKGVDSGNSLFLIFDKNPINTFSSYETITANIPGGGYTKEVFISDKNTKVIDLFFTECTDIFINTFILTVKL